MSINKVGIVKYHIIYASLYYASVTGRNACEIIMVHQEDAGLNVDVAKMVFAKGIWSYVCKMDDALRKYSSIRYLRSTSTLTAISVIQKVRLFLFLRLLRESA